jgi:hypothetical protein
MSTVDDKAGVSSGVRETCAGYRGGGRVSATSKAVFLSYASQDAEAARQICEALRAVGVEVWFDQNELVGGDAWDSRSARGFEFGVVQVGDSALARRSCGERVAAHGRSFELQLTEEAVA